MVRSNPVYVIYRKSFMIGKLDKKILFYIKKWGKINNVLWALTLQLKDKTEDNFSSYKRYTSNIHKITAIKWNGRLMALLKFPIQVKCDFHFLEC